MRAHNIIGLLIVLFCALRFLTGCAIPVESDETTAETSEEIVSGPAAHPLIIVRPTVCTSCATWEKSGWAYVAGSGWVLACIDVNTDDVRICPK